MSHKEVTYESSMSHIYVIVTEIVTRYTHHPTKRLVCLSLRRYDVRTTNDDNNFPFVGGAGQCNMGMRAWQYTGSFPCYEPYTGTNFLFSVVPDIRTGTRKVQTYRKQDTCRWCRPFCLVNHLLTVGLFDAPLLAGLMYVWTTTSSKAME
jgi:hypothetical protein